MGVQIKQSRRDRLYMDADEYADYLLSKHWQGIRRLALKRAGYRCQVCNSNTSRLEVHHRTYERLGMERDTDVIVLCCACHKIFHENRSIEI